MDLLRERTKMSKKKRKLVLFSPILYIEESWIHEEELTIFEE
ncbi:unnamed protein product [marine sediment metagenome]|uniref:Uncharacterized protein n=1 Tax=marine sediment metagenome TaxID=412755 RepID=X0Z0X8_9ZZZZ